MKAPASREFEKGTVGMKSEMVKVGVDGPDQKGRPGYQQGTLAAVLSPEVLANVSFQPDIGSRIDPDGWYQLAEQVWKTFEAMDDRERAQMIIDQITTRARLASEVGQRFAVLMSVRIADVAFPAGMEKVYGYIDPEWLTGRARIVWDHVVAKSKGYGPENQPTLEMWDDRNGDCGGFNIVVHFPPSTKVVPAGEENMFQTVISQIPRRAALEALVGRLHTSVMEIREGDERYLEKDPSHYPAGSPKKYLQGTAEPYMLKGAAKEVWDFCLANKLQPTLEYWDVSNSDGAGAAKWQSGYSIVIHWKKMEGETVAASINAQSAELLSENRPL